MYNKSENTCFKAKNNDPACMITGKTHAQQAKTENRYVALENTCIKFKNKN